MKYECVCVCVCLDSSVATLHKYMYAHSYYVGLCVCYDFHCFLGASLQFCLQCGAALGGDGRWALFGLRR